FTLNGVTATESELKNGDTLILDSLQISVVSIVEPENAAQQDKDNDFSKHWSLQVRNGRMGGQRFKINNDRPTVIGRGKESDIIIPDPHLSKKHAEIRIFDQAPVVKDLNSAVGTYLNDAPVLESPLKSGDRLRMDIFSFLVLAPGEDSNIKPPSSKQTPQKTPEELLKNIQSLKNQEYEEKEWITKPTSVGNRTHVVPNSEKRFGVGFWVALVVTTACIFGSFFLLHNFA
ncbi:MAG: FHA domain-containing protein, partial [Pseudomonadales bacterium]|nr:FHA domain-containing protein [Pseudomonadales bacterium]